MLHKVRTALNIENKSWILREQVNISKTVQMIDEKLYFLKSYVVKA